MKNGYSISARRAGFTLVELMVSVAILLGVLALVGTIFGTASKAGGQATAMATLSRQLGQAADIIEADLKGMDGIPSTRVMGIAGTVINAADTVKDNGKTYWHRADTLMMFTQREAEPYVFEQPAPPIALDGTVQVVYGHADFGHMQAGALTIDQSIESDPRLASQWHLARRVICFPTAIPALMPMPPGADVPPLTRQNFLLGYRDLAWMPWTTYIATIPGGIFPFNTDGTLAYWFENDTTGSFAWVNGMAFALGTDGFWWRFQNPGWDRKVDAGSGPVTPGSGFPTATSLPNSASFPSLRANLFYDRNANPPTPRRTVIDPKPPLPPVGVPKPMAAHFLPNCSECKVEYTYDDPRELRIDTTQTPPDVPTYSQVDPATGNPVSLPVPLPVRWFSVASGEQIIWSKLSVDPTVSAANPGSQTDPRRWPRAIRVSLRTWDAGGRLSEPMTRMITHVFSN